MWFIRLQSYGTCKRLSLISLVRGKWLNLFGLLLIAFLPSLIWLIPMGLEITMEERFGCTQT